MAELMYKIVQVTPDNLKEYPQAICYINPGRGSYGIRIE